MDKVTHSSFFQSFFVVVFISGESPCPKTSDWLTCAQGLMITLVDSFQSPLLFSLADCSFDGGDFVIVEVLQISSELLIQQWFQRLCLIHGGQRVG